MLTVENVSVVGVLELPISRWVAPTDVDQPFPRVEPAFDFTALLVESDASFAPAFESIDFDGLPFFPTALPPVAYIESSTSTASEVPGSVTPGLPSRVFTPGRWFRPVQVRPMDAGLHVSRPLTSCPFRVRVPRSWFSHPSRCTMRS